VPLAVHLGIQRLTDLKIGHYRRGCVANLVGVLLAKLKDGHEPALEGSKILQIGTEHAVAEQMIFFSVFD